MSKRKITKRKTNKKVEEIAKRVSQQFDIAHRVVLRNDYVDVIFQPTTMGDDVTEKIMRLLSRTSEAMKMIDNESQDFS